MSSHPANDPTRIPCLDGIRALSIALVLLSHMAGTAGFPAPTGAADYVGSFGQLGVRVFFLISGYLITTLLLAEHEKHGTISLLQFYFRRTFRIFPAFYVYIAVIMAAHAIGWVQLRDGDFVHAVTYTTNYHHERGWEFGHMWSLAVEEQFYLLWPAMFLLLGVRGAIISAGLYILIAPVVRVLTWKLMPEHTDGIGETFQTVADSIATGCVLAAVRPRMHEFALFRLHDRHLTPLVYVVMIFALNHVKGSITFSYPVGETMTNVLIALFIDWCLRHPGGRLGTFLDWRPLAYVGVLSYSLYLWQQPFLNRHSSALVASFPLNLMCLSAAALASYYLIEKPFLQWRARLGREWLPRRAPRQ